ncbi:atrial natriuretic peptide receptor 1-like [Babylonia areolata]|uniref:atrial natriuretic peptide receptor 1-like n=1 Tax=Babylonia areolata TaxID=304850 RepID=UPI003FD1609A
MVLLSTVPRAECQTQCQGAIQNLTVCVLIDSPPGTVRGDALTSSAIYMLDKLNRENAIPGYTLIRDIRYTYCEPATGLTRMYEARKDGAVAYVGPPCEVTCEPAGQLAKQWNMVMITYRCFSTRLSSRYLYPTVARTVGTYMEIARFIVATLHYFALSKVRLIVSRSEIFDWEEMSEEIIVSAVLVESAVVLCMFPQEAIGFLNAVKKMGFFTNEHVFITINMAMVYRDLHLSKNFSGPASVQAIGLKAALSELKECPQTGQDFNKAIKATSVINKIIGGSWIQGKVKEIYKELFTATNRGWNLNFSDDENNLEPQLSHESMHNVMTGQIFAKVTILDQQMVAVKPVNKDTLNLTSDLVIEVNQIRRLKHANVNQLVGACIEPGNVCLVWGYCTKGSLRDVLDNTNIKLDWMFKLSFVTDIARGMNYLHSSPVAVHGRLKSTNVVVDTNWCCKITDMDMPHFWTGHREDEQSPQNQYRKMLWTAPELLRDRSMQGTQKGDIYSFAIIIHEVYYREQPFGLKDEDNPAVVVQRVLCCESPPYRPPPLQGVEDVETGEENSRRAREGLRDLMEMCWDEHPLFRLSFSIISHNLMKIQRAFGATTNLVDQMLMMVRKYTDNLEQLVADRTIELEEEKKNTEQLLSRMLPQSVAEELKMGRPVIPESYTSATLFFSDIQGFSDIALNSTPIQVVNLLNDLYICFDNVIDTYDVYKVETIADNYVVSSGLPVRNGMKHAAEIATLALDLLTNVLSFTIRHLPDQQLLLRIGIHTGSVVAGVVGRKMPRYCLFGDTVNYTSRLESNGRPLHIHVSPECKAVLDKLGGFHLRERGLVEMKGKGKILTYFLVAKDGFVCEVPSLRPMARDLIGIRVNSTEAAHHPQSFNSITHAIHAINILSKYKPAVSEPSRLEKR